MSQRFLLSVVCTFYGCYIHEKIMHDMICVTCMYSRKVMNMVFVGQVSGLVGN